MAEDKKKLSKFQQSFSASQNDDETKTPAAFEEMNIGPLSLANRLNDKTNPIAEQPGVGEPTLPAPMPAPRAGAAPATPKLSDMLTSPKQQSSFQAAIIKDVKETGGTQTPIDPPKKEEAPQPKPVEELRDRLIEKKYELMRDYRDLRSKKEWAQVAEMFAKALTGYAAAREGLRKGVDLSNIQTQGVNWDAQAKQDLQELDTLLTDIRSDQATKAKKEESQEERAWREKQTTEDRQWKEKESAEERKSREKIAAMMNAARDRGRPNPAEKPLTPAERLATTKQLQAFNERNWLNTEKSVASKLADIETTANSWGEGDIGKTRGSIKEVTSALVNHLPGDAEAQKLRQEIDRMADTQIGVAGRDDYSGIFENIQKLQERARQQALSMESAARELESMEQRLGAGTQPAARQSAPATQTQQVQPQTTNLVEREWNGRKALFDSTTKKFVRFND